MELKSLRSFVAIVDFGSISKAAAHVGHAQPALSQQVSQLEVECGARLLVRSATGVQATEIGRTLYRHARLVLAQLEQAREEVGRGALGQTGIVSIGLPTTAALPLGYPLLREVRRRYPQIRLRIFESLSGYLAELLANHRLDMAVLFQANDTKTQTAIPLVHENVVLVGDVGLNERILSAPSCRLEDLRGVPLILPSPQHELRVLLDRAFAQAGLDADIVADVDSLAIMVAAAREGVACTILPSSMLAGYALERPVPSRRIASPEIGRVLGLCRLEGAPRSPAAEVVAKLVEELVPRLIDEGGWSGVKLHKPEAGA